MKKILLIVLIILITACSKTKIKDPYSYKLELPKEDLREDYRGLAGDDLDFKLESDKITTLRVDDLNESDSLTFNIYVKSNEDVKLDVFIENELIHQINEVKKDGYLIKSYKTELKEKPFFIEIKYFETIKIKVGE